MTNCYDEGRLRAYLDGELPAPKRAAASAHIAGCAACRAALDALRARAARAQALLPAPASPDLNAALMRMRGALAAPGPDTQTNTQRRLFMQTPSRVWAGRRSWLAGVAAIVAVVSLLAFPPVRAAADQLLSVFRAQKIVFMPINPERLKQLQDLDLKGDALFVGKPQAGDRTPPRSVASADEAASAVGYAVAQPAQLPSAPQSTEYTIIGAHTIEFQVNLATVRQALDLLDIHDVSLPDELGAQPIRVETQPFVAAHYRGANYDLTLNQGQSPNVTLPQGVDLAQLGKAALRVLGMSPDQAEVASRQINWSNTLLFPFPSDASNIRQVTVRGEPALLVGGGARRANHWQLYWQRGERLYVLAGTGSMQEEDMVALLTSTAESVQ